MCQSHLLFVECLLCARDSSRPFIYVTPLDLIYATVSIVTSYLLSHQPVSHAAWT